MSSTRLNSSLPSSFVFFVNAVVNHDQWPVPF